ncbi:MAG: hypothetical protein ACRD2N_10815 [Vicinamibacterales bacterium]
MTFRDRLLATLRQLRPVLEEPGILVIGSEVPNLLQPNAASTLVISQDVDLAVPVDELERVKRRLRDVVGLVPSTDEPSVYVPTSPNLIEANFLGLDRRISDASETYVLDDPELPLMVFGPVGLLRPGPVVTIEGLRLTLPRPADLMAEKLLTDRTGEKGARDLLVVAGLLATSGEAELNEFVSVAGSLTLEARHAIVSGLTVLSLMDGRDGMPDPAPHRESIAALIRRLEASHD